MRKTKLDEPLIRPGDEGALDVVGRHIGLLGSDAEPPGDWQVRVWAEIDCPRPTRWTRFVAWLERLVRS